MATSRSARAQASTPNAIPALESERSTLAATMLTTVSEKVTEKTSEVRREGEDVVAESAVTVGAVLSASEKKQRNK